LRCASVSGDFAPLFQAYTADRVVRAIRSAVDYRHLPDCFPPIVMDNAKKKKDVSELEAEGTVGTSPIKVFRMEDVSISVFARDRVVESKPITFYSVSLSRSYKDAKGNRKYTKNFDAEDLGKLIALAKEASEFIEVRRGYDPVIPRK
jgi:hypothetical protein